MDTTEWYLGHTNSWEKCKINSPKCSWSCFSELLKVKLSHPKTLSDVERSRKYRHKLKYDETFAQQYEQYKSRRRHSADRWRKTPKTEAQKVESRHKEKLRKRAYRKRKKLEASENESVSSVKKFTRTEAPELKIRMKDTLKKQRKKCKASKKKLMSPVRLEKDHYYECKDKAEVNTIQNEKEWFLDHICSWEDCKVVANIPSYHSSDWPQTKPNQTSRIVSNRERNRKYRYRLKHDQNKSKEYEQYKLKGRLRASLNRNAPKTETQRLEIRKKETLRKRAYRQKKNVETLHKEMLDSVNSELVGEETSNITLIKVEMVLPIEEFYS